jgi:putative membrane protein
MKSLIQKIILSVVANGLALYAVHYVLQDQGFEITRGVFGYACVGFMLGVLNTFVRPFLKIIGLPFVFLSMGLFLIVINAFILYITQYFFNELFDDTFAIHFSVGDGTLEYFVAAVLLSLVNTVVGWFIRKK